MRSTTAPGETARFSPGLNAVLSTCDGIPPLLTRSSAKFLNPVRRLAPRTSIVFFNASGLPSNVFVGAKASVSAETAKRARLVVGIEA